MLFVVLKFLILEKGMLVSKVILATLCAAVIGNFYLGRLDADVFEFPLVESIFSLKKIFFAFEKVFSQDLDMIKKKYILLAP